MRVLLLAASLVALPTLALAQSTVGTDVPINHSMPASNGSKATPTGARGTSSTAMTTNSHMAGSSMRMHATKSMSHKRVAGTSTDTTPR